MNNVKKMSSLINPIITSIIIFLIIFAYDYINYSYFTNWKNDLELIKKEGTLILEYRDNNQKNEYQNTKENILTIHKRLNKKIEDNKKGKTILFFKSQIKNIRFVAFQEMCIADDIVNHLE
ncbi:MAG: hypothetical protein KAI43_14010 [Candidatus Aureabacteria bacterium]|nr:hypothetical protein [Candidatus Auribacterota bacterium]